MEENEKDEQINSKVIEKADASQQVNETVLHNIAEAAVEEEKSNIIAGLGQEQIKMVDPVQSSKSKKRTCKEFEL